MKLGSAIRTPADFTPGWRLQRQRDNEFGFRDVPIEKSQAADVARNLPEAIKNMLMDVNIRAIDPVDLSKLTGVLHHEGYLSHDAWEKLGEFQIDHTGLIDPLEMTRESLRSIRGVDDTRYALCIQLYEAAIDAATSLGELIDYLNGRIVDAHA